MNIQNLNEVEISNLLQQLCRSGKVIIPQYFTKSHVISTLDRDVTEEEILNLQNGVEQNDQLQEEIFGQTFTGLL